MKSAQINMVNKLSQEQVITLNGLEAHAYPCEDGVLIDNNPLESEKDEWDEMIVEYPTFINIMNNHDGEFTSRRVKSTR